MFGFNEAFVNTIKLTKDGDDKMYQIEATTERWRLVRPKLFWPVRNRRLSCLLLPHYRFLSRNVCYTDEAIFTKCAQLRKLLTSAKQNYQTALCLTYFSRSALPLFLLSAICQKRRRVLHHGFLTPRNRCMEPSVKQEAPVFDMIS